MLIGLDVGTTGCKAVVFDERGEVRGYGFEEYGIISDEPGMAEQDPEEVWRCTCRVLRQALIQSEATEIRGLSLSVQGDAVIPIDENNKPVHNAILGMDYRSQKQAGRCAELLGDRTLFDMTGMRPHPLNSLCKILWLKEERPEAYRKSWKINTYADFILGKLGVESVIDYTMASRTMAFDLREHKWSDDILETMEIDASLFSRPEPSGTVVGEVSPDAIKEAGLPSRTLLITGGHDQTCAALGAGAVAPGLGIVSTGTAEVLSTTFNRPVLSDTMYEGFYPCYLNTQEGTYFTFSLNHVGGLLLRWFRDNFSAEERKEAREQRLDEYECMINKIPNVPSEVMVLPHFNGSGTPWCDMTSKGAIVGLTLNSTRHDVVRAILESQTYELRINLETFENAGIEITQLNAVGGGAKSPVWLQIKADILGRPIHTLKTREAACLGAAILAGTATGVFDSARDGVNCCVHRKRSYLPDPKRKNNYMELFNRYKTIYPALSVLNTPP